ncbi:MAG: class I SAM-dependent methyltransferase [Candidatus Omnitrophica bacterium]|nr:class I SAM-dependent methyltransferase [Candidatus Omnitrophota bacterium]
MKTGAILFPFEPFTSAAKPVGPTTDDQLRLIGKFNEDITNNRVAFEEAPCLCGCRDFVLIASIDRYAILQQTVMCTDCGLIRSNPRMTEAQTRDFYSSDLYRRCYEGYDYLEAFEKRKYEDSSVIHIFEAVDKARKITPGVTVIELGAGGGWNLLPFIKAGAIARGIEYSPSLVELGRKHGVDMAQGDANDIRGVYDVVIINHVLEHLPDPVGLLKKITKHMHDGSVIYIGVPNIMNFGISQLQGAHTYYFTPWTLEYFCSKAGLRLIMKGPAQKVHMFGIFKKGAPVMRGGLKGHYLKMRSHLGFIRLKYRVKTVLSGLGLYKQADGYGQNI